MKNKNADKKDLKLSEKPPLAAAKKQVKTEKPAKKPQSPHISPKIVTAKTATAAPVTVTGNERPTRPTGKGRGKRGPDRAPRKRRPGEPEKIHAPEASAENEKQETSDADREQVHALAPRVRAYQIARLIVLVSDAICARMLPPRFSDGERAVLIEAWADYIETLQNMGSPLTVAVLMTSLVLGSRILPKILWRKK